MQASIPDEPTICSILQQSLCLNFGPFPFCFMLAYVCPSRTNRQKYVYIRHQLQLSLGLNLEFRDKYSHVSVEHSHISVPPHSVSSALRSIPAQTALTRSEPNFRPVVWPFSGFDLVHHTNSYVFTHFQTEREGTEQDWRQSCHNVAITRQSSRYPLAISIIFFKNSTTQWCCFRPSTCPILPLYNDTPLDNVLTVLLHP